MNRFNGKNIIIGITGGIAGYKICDLIRLLVKENFNVEVIMTKSACEFITPLTIQTLTGNPVYTELFTLIKESKIGHISLAEKADCMVIAPATANVIGKIASGIADDLLTTTVLATKAPVLIVPSMNKNMWENPVVIENIKKISKYHTIMNPAEGLLACGVYGSGKLPEVDDIFEMIKIVLSPKPLLGKKVLVTAGPTIEEIDPVRFISNYSSGKMGYAIARVAKRLGAEVVLVSGRTALKKPYGVETHYVKSAKDMLNKCKEFIEDTDILVKCAAVADYKPESRADKKIKKGKDNKLTLNLIKNPDILFELSKYKKKGAIFIGFAAETEDAEKNAIQKLTNKNLDMIVVNNVAEKDAGFEKDTNRVILITKTGKLPLPLMTKEEVAYNIFDHLKSLSLT
ncbi:MAG: bifunctional phosphopantothenoylcysteine decarboxylase/phosphopantothenate--cysteine ligase CoaBC [Proteobacteria bacterium]|nr:bifunctional phosphopantothenoylcysteine decarboxylase/phosphopantothenate--cysteine ligase CoaBC [Pseudomonadota bacterium]